jgi:two-component sensor histidine kinase
MPALPALSPLFGRLGLRQALLLSATLLPIGVILMIQISAVQRESQARGQAALTGATLSAGATVLRQIEEGRGAARALAALMPDIMDDPARCSAALRAFVDGAGGTIRFAGFIPNFGPMLCATEGQGRVFEQNPSRDALMADPRPVLTVSAAGAITGESVVIVGHPVSAGGEHLGYVSLSLPHRGFEGIAAESGEARPTALITFDGEGTILTGSSGLQDAAARVPADRALKALAVDRPASFAALSVTGGERIYSVVPIVPGQLFLLGSWRVEDMGGVERLGGLPPTVFAALMWLASLGTAILGAERLVSRHVRALSRSMTAFAGGNRRVALPDLSTAPAEMRDAGEAYARLTEAILHDEAELENALHHKDVLLREVHHRVKNNLQLIASIMNLQMRKARSPEARNLLRGLQERVMSLATVHKELYQTSGVADVRADELLSDITQQVLKIATGGERRFEVHMAFDRIVLTPDQAVPLALLTTEALTNAIKYAGAAEGRPSRLSVSMVTEGADNARLEIVNTIASPEAIVPGDEGIADSTGLGTQLLTAFAQQVGGQLDTRTTDHDYRLTLTFSPRPHDPEPEDEPAHEPQADQADT